jgi:RNA polymerase sigma-70 factor, ECF subfamily
MEEVGLREEERPGVAAIEAIYRTKLGQFCRVASGILGDPQAAQDAVQDGFVRAIKDRRSFRGEAPLEAWVWGCVRNATRTSARRRKPVLEPSPTTQHAEARDADPDEHIRRLIRQLPERQRLVLFLRYFADLDYETIAAILGVAPGTVAAALHVAHASIGGALKEGGR